MSLNPLDETSRSRAALRNFWNFFEIAYDQKVVHVNRLHILQRFHDYLGTATRQSPEALEPRREIYKRLLQRAYQDFVESDALTEKVFAVFHEAAPIRATSSPLEEVGCPQCRLGDRGLSVKPRFDYGDAVRVVRTLRNDGTFPGLDTGVMLVREGSVGHVHNVGTFLQDQIIYAVHFLHADRTVGCREEELIDAHAPWMPTRFLFGDQVTVRVPLAVRGEVVVAVGQQGEVIKVLRDQPGGPAYHVYFDGRTFQVPETALARIDGQMCCRDQRTCFR